MENKEEEEVQIVEKKKRVKKVYNLLPYQNENKIEIGIDEAGAGTFFGSLFVAGVILPKNIKELMDNDKKVIIRDSKKMNQKQRDYAYDFIIKNAIEYNIISKTHKEVDDMNILRARLTGFHEVIRGMKTKPEKILIDGDKFESYYDEKGKEIESECVIEGDNTYLCIAAASILAKTSQIRHIEKLVEENPDLKKYDIHNNHGYGTPRHLNGIKEFGVTEYHRLSFGICRKYSNGKFVEKVKVLTLTKENLDKLNNDDDEEQNFKESGKFVIDKSGNYEIYHNKNEKEQKYLFSK